MIETLALFVVAAYSLCGIESAPVLSMRDAAPVTAVGPKAQHASSLPILLTQASDRLLDEEDAPVVPGAGDDLDASVGQDIEGGIGPHIEDGIGPNIEGGIGPDIEGGIGPNPKGGIGPDLKGAIGEDLGAPGFDDDGGEADVDDESGN